MTVPEDSSQDNSSLLICLPQATQAKHTMLRYLDQHTSLRISLLTNSVAKSDLSKRVAVIKLRWWNVVSKSWRAERFLVSSQLGGFSLLLCAIVAKFRSHKLLMFAEEVEITAWQSLVLRWLGEQLEVLITSVESKSAWQQKLPTADICSYLSFLPEVNPLNISNSFAKGSLNLPMHKTVLLYFGRLKKHNGIEEVLELYRGLDKDKFHLLIYSQDADEMQEYLNTVLNSIRADAFTYMQARDSVNFIHLLFCASQIHLLYPANSYDLDTDLALAAAYNCRTIVAEGGQREYFADLQIPSLRFLGEDQLAMISQLPTHKLSLLREHNKSCLKFLLAELANKSSDLPWGAISAKL